MVRKRISLSQNFLVSSDIVHNIILLSSINKNDIVYEIGPGEGIITRELAKAANIVIAIEKDPELICLLKQKLSVYQNVKIILCDFLKYRIIDEKYKIFSNIPFNITSNIVRKIIFTENPPLDSFLIVQKEAAERIMGYPNETLLSVLIKPKFEISVVKNFSPYDFHPIPNVNIVMIRILKKNIPLVEDEHYENYVKFVSYGYKAWKKNLKKSYKRIFRHKQWIIMSKNYNFEIDAIPTDINVNQWIDIFQSFLNIVPNYKKSIILDDNGGNYNAIF